MPYTLSLFYWCESLSVDVWDFVFQWQSVPEVSTLLITHLSLIPNHTPTGCCTACGIASLAQNYYSSVVQLLLCALLTFMREVSEEKLWIEHLIMTDTERRELLEFYILWQILVGLHGPKQ